MSDVVRQNIYGDISEERWRQLGKWGPQVHPDGTGRISAKVARNVYTQRNDYHVGTGKTNWQDILLEEVYEALAETDRVALRAELIQSAAVIVAWLEDLDGRGAGPDARP